VKSIFLPPLFPYFFFSCIAMESSSPSLKRLVVQIHISFTNLPLIFFDLLPSYFFFFSFYFGLLLILPRWDFVVSIPSPPTCLALFYLLMKGPFSPVFSWPLRRGLEILSLRPFDCIPFLLFFHARSLVCSFACAITQRTPLPVCVVNPFFV